MQKHTRKVALMNNDAVAGFDIAIDTVKLKHGAAAAIIRVYEIVSARTRGNYRCVILDQQWFVAPTRPEFAMTNI